MLQAQLCRKRALVGQFELLRLLVCHSTALSFILAGFTGDCQAITLLRPVASKLYCKEHSEYEDSGLHEAGPAEGRSAQTQRERYVDPRRRLLRSQRAGRLCP